jgi:DNA segregation ATPase FtsK/SpoIIIE-like protein
MVYTIISKLPFITSDKSNRRFFKIFVFGSLIYILLHYYLFQKDQEGILDSVKTYLYYAMAIDFCVAYTLDQWMGSPQDEDQKIEEDLPNSQKSQKQIQNNQSQTPQTQHQQTQHNNQNQQNKYTPEQRAEYERKYAEWRKQQEFANKKEKGQNEQKSEKQVNDDEARDEFEVDDVEIDEEPSLPKVNKKSRNAERSEKSGNSKKSSKSGLVEDTDIPRFVNSRQSN